jgi:hypothetical protein
VEHWDLPNTEIFQSKDVASGLTISNALLNHKYYLQSAKLIEVLCQISRTKKRMKKLKDGIFFLLF